MTRRPETPWSLLWPGSLPLDHDIDDDDEAGVAARIVRQRDPLAVTRNDPSTPDDGPMNKNATGQPTPPAKRRPRHGRPPAIQRHRNDPATATTPPTSIALDPRRNESTIDEHSTDSKRRGWAPTPDGLDGARCGIASRNRRGCPSFGFWSVCGAEIRAWGF